MWLALGLVVAGRFIIVVVNSTPDYFFLALTDFYLEVLLAIVLIVFPFLYDVTFGVLPLQHVAERRRLRPSDTSAGIVIGAREGSPAKTADDQLTSVSGDQQLRPVLRSENLLANYAAMSSRIADGLYKRAGVYLILGVLIAFSGLFFFYTQTSPRIAASTNLVRLDKPASSLGILSERLADLAPRFGILFFIEFVAFFFLRQYRSAMDEFRYFEAIKRSREEMLVLAVMAMESKLPIDFGKVVESGRFFSSAGKLAPGESTELLETRKLTKDELALFEQIVATISSRKPTT